MSALSMTLPDSVPAACSPWRSHAVALAATLGLHASVLGLLLHGWTPELNAPQATQVLRTQLVSLPPPEPMAEVQEPQQTAAAEPVEQVVKEPEPDPRIERQRLEQAELALERAEQEKQEATRLQEQRRLREQQQRERRERERQERLEAERQRHEAEQREARRREELAREAQQREQAEAAAAERAREAEAAASRQYLPIAKQAPAYPPRALDKGIEGTCTVSYSVNPQGRIENPKTLDDCHPLFIQPSLAAAKRFRYQPRIIDGRAVTVPEVKNTFHYRIQ